MAVKLNSSISVRYIAKILRLRFIGSRDRLVSEVAPLHEAAECSISFSTGSVPDRLNGVVVAGFTEGIEDILISERPRLDYIRVMRLLDRTPGFQTPNFTSRIDKSVSLGRNIVIEEGVEINAGSIIEDNVILKSGTSVGRNCIIRANSHVGIDGFGFERDENRIPIRFPHVGGVHIESGVEIGNHNTIQRGTLSNTLISEHVKTDSHVHIGHNSRIGRGVLITAGVIVCGGCSVGAYSWIGVNSNLKDGGLSIGENSVIGMGSNVLGSIPSQSVVFGNPARRRS